MTPFKEVMQYSGTRMTVVGQEGLKVPGYFYGGRVSTATMPSNWHLYEFFGCEESNEWIEFYGLKPVVLENFTGSFLTTKELPLDKHKNFLLDIQRPDGGWYQT